MTGLFGGVAIESTLFLDVNPSADASSYSYQTPLMLRFSFLGPGLMRCASAFNEAAETAECKLAVSDIVLLVFICDTELLRLSTLRIMPSHVCES